MKSHNLAVFLIASTALLAHTQRPAHPIVYVSQSGGAVDKLLYNALRRDVAEKYAVLSPNERLAVVSADLKREGYYWIGIDSVAAGTPSGTRVSYMYSAYTTHGHLHVEYPLHTCKDMRVAACAKEAFDYLDTIIQQDWK
jgi:hypothetical protein